MPENESGLAKIKRLQAEALAKKAETAEREQKEKAEALESKTGEKAQVEQEIENTNTELSAVDSEITEANAVDLSELDEDTKEAIETEMEAMKGKSGDLRVKLSELMERKSNLDNEINALGGESETAVEATVSEKPVENESTIDNSPEPDESLSIEVNMDEDLSSEPHNESEQVIENKVDRLPNVDVDELIAELPDWAKENDTETRRQFEIYKTGSLADIIRLKSSNLAPLGAESARSDLWQKRVENLKPEFQAVFKKNESTVGMGDFIINESKFNNLLESIPEEIKKMQERAEEIRAIPDNQKGSAETGQLRFAEERIQKNKDFLRMLEALKGNSDYSKLTADWYGAKTEEDKKKIEFQIEDMMLK